MRFGSTIVEQAEFSARSFERKEQAKWVFNSTIIRLKTLAPQTIDQLRAEIEALHTKIRAEEHRNQDFADELNQIKESCVEKSDNIQKGLKNLKKILIRVIFRNQQAQTILRAFPFSNFYGAVQY